MTCKMNTGSRVLPRRLLHLFDERKLEWKRHDRLAGIVGNDKASAIEGLS